MNDYYLKTTDEAALFEALLAAGLANEVPDQSDPLNQRPMDAAEDWQPTGAKIKQPIHGLNLDIIGVIHRPTGNTIQQGEFTVPEMVALDGYHANIRADLTDAQAALLPLIPKPNSPSRVWA